MKLWWTSRHLSFFFLLVSSIWFAENQRFIRDCKRRTKKVAWNSTFCGQFFQPRLTFFWQSSWLCACLKVESYTEAENSACWKLALMINYRPISIFHAFEKCLKGLCIINYINILLKKTYYTVSRLETTRATIEKESFSKMKK